ncbi:MAG: hypothetical protein HY816_03000 [Candidatus Wallbacteria bacterium]|nr:hypothetical protein [Candidatus Wallbacteria bacterium]
MFCVRWLALLAALLGACGSPEAAMADDIDLAVTELAIQPGRYSAGGELIVTATVSNQGSIHTAGFSYTRLLLEPVDASATAFTSQPLPLTEAFIDALEPGASRSSTLMIDLPRQAGPGQWRIRAAADSYGFLSESDELNNERSTSPFTVAATDKDLVVTSLLPDVSSVSVGDTFSVSLTIANRGTLDGVSLRAYFATELLLEPSPASPTSPEGDPVSLTTDYTSGLLPGQSQERSLRGLLLPRAVAPGDYRLVAKVDVFDAIAESDEFNNRRDTPLTVTATTANLVADSVRAPLSAVVSEIVTLTVALRNAGSSPLAQPFWTRVVLSQDPVFTTSDVLVTEFSSQLPEGGGRDSALTVQSVVQMPRATPGEYFVGAIADVYDSAAETSEADNTRAALSKLVLRAPPHDLVVTRFEAPPTTSAGGYFPATFVVQNVGASGIAPSSQLSIHASSDPLATATSPAIASFYIQELRAGEKVTFEQPIQFPRYFPAGRYSLAAVADAYDYVAETREDNNLESSSNQIDVTSPTVDLVVTGLQLPSTTISQAETLSASLTIRNQGSFQAAQFFNSKLQLAPLDSQGAPIESQSYDLAFDFVELLPAGQQAIRAIPFTVPRFLAPGQYLMRALVDGYDQVFETDETNNSRSLTQPLTIAPPTVNLLVDSFQSPPAVSVGDYAPMTAVVRNAGTSALSAPFIVRFQHSDSSGYPLNVADQYVSGAGMAPGESLVVQGSVFISQITSDSASKFVAIADIADQVAESNELDNASENATRIAPPTRDLAITRFDAATQASVGGYVPVTVTVQNVGPISVGYSYGAVRLSTDPPPSSSYQELTNFYVPELAPGQSMTFELLAGLARHLGAGSYYVSAAADAYGHVPEADETNNQVSEAHALTVTAPRTDLVGPTLVLPATTFSIGDSFVMTMVVANAGTSDPARYHYNRLHLVPLDGNGSPVTSSALLLTDFYADFVAPGTSVALSGHVRLPRDVAPGAYVLVADADVYDQVNETSETNNRSAGAPIQLVSPTANLTLLSIAHPPVASIGEVVTLTAVVRNTGSSTVRSPFTVRFAVASTPGTTQTTVSYDLSYWGFYPPNGLAAGELATVEAQVTLPSIPPGPYALSAYVDVHDEVPESEESDNQRVSSVVFALDPSTIDLVVTRFEASGSASVGGLVPVTISLRNDNASTRGRAGGFHVVVAISADLTASSASPTLGAFYVPQLGAGESTTLEGSLVLDRFSFAPGSYALAAFADYYNNVPERDDANNGRDAPTRLEVRPVNVDLIAHGLSVSKRTFSIGETFVATLTARNGSASSSTAPFYSTLSLVPVSEQGLPKPTQAIQVWNFYSDAMSPGSELRLTAYPLVSRGIPPGSYLLRGEVDTYDSVFETDESNNSTTVSAITVVLPDANLQVRSVSGPNTASAGELIGVTAVIANLGTTPIPQFFNVRFFVSEDLTLTADDTAIAILGAYAPGGLAPGEVLTVSGFASLPDLNAGRYTLGAQADAYDEVAERNESDNFGAASSPLQLAPSVQDLVVSRFLAPATASAGSYLPVSFTVQNLAPSGRSSSSQLVMRLTSGPVATEASPVLASFHVPDLGPGDSYAVDGATLYLDRSLVTGSYAIAAFADGFQQVAESVESNNVRAARERLTLSPPDVDLVIASLQTPRTEFSERESFVVTVTVKNLSRTQSSGFFHTRVNLVPLDPAGAPLLADARFVGESYIHQLGAGEQQPLALFVQLPSGLGRGDYQLRATADNYDQVLETREDNNEGRPLTVSLVGATTNLVVTEVNGPAEANQGQHAVVAVTVRNVGASPIYSAFHTQALLTSDITPTAGNPSPTAGDVSGTFSQAELGYAYVSVPGLGLLPGEELKSEIGFRVPRVALGQYRIRGVADPFDQIGESDEYDNAKLADPISIRPPSQDLAVTRVRLLGLASAGSLVPATVTVSNVGTSGLQESSFVTLLLSSGASVTNSSQRFGGFWVPPLQAGESTTLEGLVQLPYTDLLGVALPISSTYAVGAFVDPDDSIPEIREENNVRTSSARLTLEAPDADLQVTALEVSSAVVSVRDSLAVTLTVRNAGTRQAAFSFHAGLRLVPEASVSLTETYVFAAYYVERLSAGTEQALSMLVRLPYEAPAGRYRLVADADAFGQVAESDEANNLKELSGGLMLAPPTANLVLERVHGPATASVGSVARVTAVVVNLGSTTIRSAFTVMFGLSSDSDFDPNTDMQLGSFGAYQPDGLAPGERATVEGEVRIPRVPVAAYTVGARADAYDEVAESDELDNTRSSSVVTHVSSSTLDLTVIGFEAPASAPIGSAAPVTVTVKNLSRFETADNPQIELRLSSGPVATATGSALGFGAGIYRLEPGESQTVSGPMYLPRDLPVGSYAVAAFVDPYDNIPELQEGNNSKAAASRLELFSSDADVKVAETSPAPSQVAFGEAFGLTLTVANVAERHEARYFHAGFRALPLDSRGEVLAGGRSYDLGWVFVETLGAGQRQAFSMILQFPLDAPVGHYRLVALADPFEQLLETDERNNSHVVSSSLTLNPASIDLRPTELSFPAQAIHGEFFNVRVGFVNAGSTQASGCARVSVVISTSSSLPSSQSIELAATDWCALEAGHPVSFDLGARLPPGTQAGSYFVGLKLDSVDVIPETSEGNNVLLSGSRLDVTAPTADLVLTSLTGPAAVSQGEGFLVTAVVKNAGSGDVRQGFGVSLSVREPATSQEYGLSGFWLEGLTAGGQFEAQMFAVVPRGLSPGSYQLFAAVDPHGQVGEVEESNNTRTAAQPLVVTASTANLQVVRVEGPASASVGETLRVTAEVKNVGVTTIRSDFYVRLRLAPQSGFDPGDFTGHLSDSYVSALGGLAPGATVRVEAEGRIGRLQTGSYRVGATADIYDQVAETDEADNSAASAATLSVGGPTQDLTVSRLELDASGSVGGSAAMTMTLENRATSGSVSGVLVSLDLLVPSGSAPGSPVVSLTVYSEWLPQVRTGESLKLERGFSVPRDLPVGRYGLVARIDPYDEIPETNERNNHLASSAQLELRHPDTDLVVDRVTPGRTIASAGQSLPVSMEIRNLGTRDLARLFHVGVQVAPADTTLTAPPLDIGYEYVPQAVGTTTETIRLLVFMPRFLAKGRYRLFAKVDPFDQVLETDELNNTVRASEQIEVRQVASDLVVVSGSAPSELGLGDSGRATVRIQNPGTVGIDTAFEVRLELWDPSSANGGMAGPQPVSGRPLPQRSVAPLGAVTVPGLTAGEHRDVGVELVVPAAVEPGVYPLASIVDAGDRVAETDEFNNTLVLPMPLTVTAPAVDLVVAAVSGPARGRPGQDLALFAELVNTGTQDAPAFSIRFELAQGRSNITSALEFALATEELASGVPAGQSQRVGPVAAYLPSDLAPGEYFVRAVADVYGQVAEHDEANNQQTAATPLKVDTSATDDHPNTAGLTQSPRDALPIDRTPMAATLEAPGDSDFFQFGVTDAGALIVAEVQRSSVRAVKVRLLGPQGTELASNTLADGSLGGLVGPVAAPSTGTHKLSVSGADVLDTGAYSVSLSVQSDRPDLLAKSVNIGTRSDYRLGEELVGSLVLSNLGPGLAPSGAEYSVELSRDPGSAAAVTVARGPIPALKAAETVKLAFVAFLDERLLEPGTYTVTARADGQGRLSDRNPANNVVVAARRVALSAPPDDHPNGPSGPFDSNDLLAAGSAAVGGLLETAGDRDCFELSTNPGKVYEVRVKLADLTDSVLEVTDSSGLVLAFNDDEEAGSLASRVLFEAPTGGGKVFVQVRGFDRAQQGGYAVEVTEKETLYPDEFGSTRETAGVLSLGSPLGGRISPATDKDLLRVTVRSGVEYRLDLLPGTLSTGRVSLLLEDGETVAQEAVSPEPGSAAVLAFQPDTSGPLYLRVDGGGGQGTYTLVFSTLARPRLSVRTELSGDLIKARVVVDTLPSRLKTMTALVRVDPEVGQFTGAATAGNVAAGLKLTIRESGSPELFAVELEPAGPLSGIINLGTEKVVFGFEVRAAKGVTSVAPGMITLLAADFTLTGDEAYSLRSPQADPGPDFDVAGFGPTGAPLSTIVDPLLPEPDNRRGYIRLDGSKSSDPNIPASPLKFKWSVVNAPGPVTLTEETSGRPTFTASKPGVHVFALVTDNGSLKSSRQKIKVLVKQEGNSPTADARARQGLQVTPPDLRRLNAALGAGEIVLDGSSSVDPNEADNQALSYSWQQLEGPPIKLSSATAVSPTFTPAEPGLYRFELVVADPGGLQSKPSEVEVLVSRAGYEVPALSLAASASTTSATGGALAQSDFELLDRSLAVTLPTTVSLKAIVTDADVLGARAAQVRIAWSQIAGPPVNLSSLGTPAGRQLLSEARFVPTSARVYEFECTVDKYDAAGTATGQQVSRQIRVVVHSPTNDVPTARVSIGGSAIAKTGGVHFAGDGTSRITVPGGTKVTLDGSSSFDTGRSANENLSASWVQTLGPSVTLDTPRAISTTFVAPYFSGSDKRQLVFELQVDDGLARSAPAKAIVDVTPTARPREGSLRARGLTFVALPVAAQRNGRPYEAQDLAEDLSATFVARVAPAGVGQLGSFRPFLPRVSTTFELLGNHGYVVAGSRAVRQKTVTGPAWDSVYAKRTLNRGLNMLGLPANAPADYDLDDLAAAAASPFVAYTEESGGVFKVRVHIPGLSGPPPVAVPGKGYLVNSSADSKEVTFPTAP